jgi:YegS/Rv2252/BmrU family lipid kinase
MDSQDTSNRHLVIVNPAAGGGRCGKKAPGAIERLRSAGLDLEVRETQGPGDATRIARQGWAEGFRRFIAAGGDGTDFEVLNGMLPLALESGETPRLGFLPLGTGNAFLRDFSDQGAEYAIESLIEGRSRPSDVLVLHHDSGLHYFINLIGFGLPVDVTIKAAGGLKRFGALGYVLGVLMTVANLRFSKFPMRGGNGALVDHPVTQLCICNSRYTADMLIAPQADHRDGLVDVVRVDPMGRFELLRAFPTIFKGTHLELEKVYVESAAEITFEFEEAIDMMIDGEVLRLRPRRVEALQEVLEICA